MKHPVMGYENLHRHSDFSLLDGFAKVSEYAEYQKTINQKYLSISDHGTMGAVPQQIAECEKHNLFPVFAIELYINSMQPKVSNRGESAEIRKSLGDGSKNATPEQKKFDKSSHLLALAYNDVGYSNLVRLSSWAWIHGFYRRPRINHEVLVQYKEGIIFTSTCGNSEIANAFFEHGDDSGFAMVEKYMAMFGSNFYLELMMLDWKMQKPYDAFLLRAHDKYHVPLILTQDCFVADTLITTDKGIKPICDIVAGDCVLTHDGNWELVEVVGSRSLKKEEAVYRVKTEAGTYAYEATGDHEMYVANKNDNQWNFTWKKTHDLTSGKDYLVIPKIAPEMVFAKKDAETIDILPFLEGTNYQIGEQYDSSRAGNMACRLQFNEESQEFWSYRGWDRKCKTVVPRYLPIDNDLLEIIGWYIAEGWSEKKSNQVGFAFHTDEQYVADWVIAYFARFGIEAKTYKVSNKGIVVRFSSVVFNRFFGQLCGFGANHKHLPRFDKTTWLRKWSQKQVSTILRCYWRGDGSNAANNNGIVFASTSRLLIHEISTVFLACGVVSMPCVEKARKVSWHDKHYLSFTGIRGDEAVLFLMKGCCELAIHRDVLDIGESYVLPVKSVQEIDYQNLVYCFQVANDHSFTANFYACSNCHYCRKEHSHNQRLMLMQQNRRTLADIQALIDSGEAEDLFELQDTNLWLKSEEELNEKWELDYNDTIDYELFKQAKANTVKICEIARNVQIDRELKLPKFPDAEQVLLDEIKKGFVTRACPKTDQYEKRIKEEYELIVEKGFASYFLMQKMMTDEARAAGPRILGFGDGSEAVGCGRGSVCGSLVAYCLRLHDVEPIIHDLRFSRFLSPARGGKQMKTRFSIDPVAHEEIKV